MNAQKQLKEVIANMLEEEQAHISFADAVKDIPDKFLGVKPSNLPYSIWQLTEHIRITQWDIVQFSSNPDHISPNWPEEYWPKTATPTSIKEWEKSVQAITEDRKKMINLVKAPEADLLKPFSYGTGQNLLREAILIIDHSSYHTGEIVVVRRALGIWK